MSTGNYSRTPQAQHYTVHHVDPTRIYNQQQLEKVSVATHPPSSTNSPVSLIYHPDLKRSLLCLNKTSNPQRVSQQLSKSGDSGGGQEPLYPVQPNVTIQFSNGNDKNKTSTPTHSTYSTLSFSSFTETNKGQQILPPFSQRARKSSGEVVSGKLPVQSPTVYQTERRINLQQPGTVLFRTAVNGSPYNAFHNQQNLQTSGIGSHMPLTTSPNVPLNEQNIQNEAAGGNVYRMDNQCMVMRGSPSSNLSQNNKLTVKFEYQQPTQTEGNRLDRIKNMKYAELVSRQNMPQPSTDRVMVNRYSMDHEDGKNTLLTSSMKDINNKLSQSMHNKTNEGNSGALEMKTSNSYNQKSTDRPSEKPQSTDKIFVKKQQHEGLSIKSQTQSSVTQANNEPDNAFKKDKRLSLEPSKSSYDPTKQSPQNFAPKKQQLEQKKTNKLSQTFDESKQYLRPKNTPTANDFISTKYSPTSFTKVKTDGSNVCSQIPESPSPVHSSHSQSPRKFTKRRPSYEDFKFGRKLGKGKYGEVFMAEHIHSGFLCAIKIIPKELVKQENVEHQLIREIKLQSHMRHENIVQLYGYFDDPKNFYLLMELCSDGQLADVLKERKRLTQAEASIIVDQLCRGVDYMHRHRVIHRDIKPQNIIMQDGIVKICDFGWAVHIKNGLRQTFCGTPLYVSPQVLKGDFYDEKIDIWAIGILTYELLVGRAPFRINCQSDLSKIINDEIAFPEYVEVSDRARDFINKALQKNPLVRMEMDDLLNHQFLQDSRSSDYLRNLCT